MTSITNLERITAKTLSEKLLEEKESKNPTFAVVDVRDDDHIGGHIKGSFHVPSHQLTAMMPTLVRKLKDKDTVIFHCALSQQRGPSAALKYLRERDGLLRILGEKSGANEEEKDGKAQKVCVLEGGFSRWQEVYGEDESLTEAYVKDLWLNY